ncbi:hypothetical protein PM082_016555 [Marasmius tenuissimus]|nr:hypothetical protein PM082_016555 [Marasmius tenuissimus]
MSSMNHRLCQFSRRFESRGSGDVARSADSQNTCTKELSLRINNSGVPHRRVTR